MFHKLLREDNFLSLAGNLVIAFFGLAGFALLARTVTVTEFGQWMLFISAGSFVEMFRFGITNTGLIRYLSGASAGTRQQLIGSNIVIGAFSTGLIILLLLSANLLFGEALELAGYGLFFTWYPVLAILNLPWNNALVVLQADRRFGAMLFIKAVNSILFFAVILYTHFTHAFSLNQLVLFLLLVNGITSLLAVVSGWDGLRFTFKADKAATWQLLHFGKYTTFTLIGTNLLRSADAIIISMSPMGVGAVALYSIPLKLTELQQIPLRSFAATAFPKMSKASLLGNNNEVKNIFYTYTGAISLLFVAGSLLTFLFAEWFVYLLAGNQYLVQGAGAAFNVVLIMQVFSLYGLLLPLDRMTGIALDSINRPGVNALKVLVMVVANIAGDIVAVFVIKSLVMVAVASILFTLVGIWLGFYFLNRELKLSVKEIFTQGMQFYRDLYAKFILHRGHLVKPS